MAGQQLSIGDAASRLALAPHVLRHWELVGVLVPGRTASGHRRYSDDDLDRARLIRRLRHAGLSLGEIRTLTTADRAGREVVVAHRLAKLSASLGHIQRAITFLEHTRQCQHRAVALCPECQDFVCEPPWPHIRA